MPFKILQTVRCFAVSDHDKVLVRVLLDSASTITLCTRAIARKIGLVGKTCTLQLSVAGGGETTRTREEEVSFRLESLKGDYITPMVGAVTCKTVTTPLRAVNLSLGSYEHLKNIKFTEVYPQKQNCPIDVMLDTNIYCELLSGDIVKGPFINQPKAIPTLLGYVLGGEYDDEVPALTTVQKMPEFHYKKVTSTSTPVVIPDYEAFMKLEDIGISSEDSKLTFEEEAAVEMMAKVTEYDKAGKTYWTELLWKVDPHTHLESNFGPAKHIALSGKKNSIAKGKEEEVNAAYADQLTKGFAEEVPKTELFPKNPVYHIPTHPVYRPDKLTTKVRIVMNASYKCKSTGYSLNDCLYQGPCLIPDLVKILFLFRLSRYVTICDIAKMFFTIKVKKPDTDCMRFLWQWKSDDPLTVFRMAGLAFGVISAPFQAIWTVLDHCRRFQTSYPLAASTIRETIYMDDVMDGKDDFDEAVESSKQIAELFMLASMKPHKWNSNNLDILRKAGIVSSDWANVQNQKVLGVQWDSVKDVICFDFTEVADIKVEQETKRTLIQQAAKMFDPLGLIAPFTLKAKLLFQACWKAGMDWDNALPEAIEKEWLIWKADIKDLKSISQPRLLTAPGERKWLAVFADASKDAYGTCAYVVSKSSSQLLFAKTRVAPLKRTKLDDKELSIARLELLAALIAARVGNYIQTSLKEDFFSHKALFTDSLITLCRIKNGPQQYKVWVANRLKELLSYSAPEEWHFIPGQLNPADLASRSARPSELLNNSIWWNGPAFLLLPLISWPIHKALTKSEAEKQNETDKLESITPKLVGRNMTLLVHKSDSWTAKLTARVSSWLRVIRITVWIIRFLRNKFPLLKKCLLFRNEPLVTVGHATVAELRLAQLFWLRGIQQSAFIEEYDNLQLGSDLSKHSMIRQFQPFIDSRGVLRSQTRLSLSEKLPEETINPIILPKKNDLIARYILHLHASLGHSSPGSTLYYLRRQFRLIGGKREVDRILFLCKKINCNKPLPLSQRMAPLPTSRTDVYKPWDNVAVDFFGPMLMRHSCDKRDCPHSKEEKGYGCIFSCLSTRAIHLELVENLEVTTFLNAFSKMASRKGMPSTVWSDNAKTFKAADRELQRLHKQIDWSKVTETAAIKNIQWNYGIELSPHTNGVIERMVKVTKVALRKSLGQNRVTKQRLETILIEIEGLVNDRPLVTQSLDETSPLTITPAQLCLGRQIRSLPLDRAKVSEDVPFTKLQQYRKELLQKFWRTWRHDYLLSLQSSKYWFDKNTPPLEINQIVLIREDHMAKGRWKLGRVSEIFRGKDGLPRRIRLQINTGKNKPGFVDRHINKLSLLEGSAIEAVRSKPNLNNPPTKS